jgi:hypothetical protein
MKIHPVGTELFQTDTDMTKLTFAFRNLRMHQQTYSSGNLSLLVITVYLHSVSIQWSGVNVGHVIG